MKYTSLSSADNHLLMPSRPLCLQYLLKSCLLTKSCLLRTCVNTKIDISGPFPKRHFCRIKTSKVLFNYAICAAVVFPHAAVKNPVSYSCPGLLKYAFFTVKRYSYLSVIGQTEIKPQKTFFDLMTDFFLQELRGNFFS